MTYILPFVVLIYTLSDSPCKCVQPGSSSSALLTLSMVECHRECKSDLDNRKGTIYKVRQLYLCNLNYSQVDLSRSTCRLHECVDSVCVLGLGYCSVFIFNFIYFFKFSRLVVMLSFCASVNSRYR